MKTNSAIRQEALALMKGNWGSAVGVAIVLYLIIYAIALVSLLLGMFVGGPIDEPGETILGQVFSLLTTFLLVYPIVFASIKMFLHFVRGEHKLYVGGLFKCFSKPYYSKSIGVFLLISIFTFLWALLLIVPGIIKSLAYSLAPFILADNPELSANQAINKSMKMMKGHKMDLFLIMLGYMGFALLSILALGIPLLWVVPYYQAVLAKFYEEVKADYNPTVC